MADSKITALASIGTGTDPANDPLVIVDVSDILPGGMSLTGTTKKVTLNNLLACSPTATLASATISGDLTVDTSTLKVDSANNRVGIRTASPAEPLTVDNSSGVTTGAIRIYATDQSHSRLSIQNGNGQAYHLVAGNPGASNAGFALYDNTAAATRWYVDNTGIHTWQNVGGVAGTAMTLNSTGLGVGVASPSQKLDIIGSLATRAATTGANQDVVSIRALNSDASAYANALYYANSQKWYYAGASFGMMLDASGNLLVGTTSGGLPARLSLSGDSGTTKWAVGPYTNAATNFYVTANNSQGVFLNGTTATAWSAISDERFKDIIEPISNAVAKVGSLRSVIGKFKTDAEGTRRSFLIAQDLLSAFPEAVVANNPDKLAVTYTEVIPLLVAAIKELTARVQTLETR